MKTLLPRMVAAAALTLAGSALAQNYDAMIRQQMQQMNQNIERGNQQINQMVQQRMQDPQVRASYEQYLYQQRMRGQPAMDYPTYTYNYIYTRGFSADGTAHARANEANISANERAKVQDLRNAEAQRGMAQQQQRDSYFANQQEAGRGLVGQSTYIAPNGYAMQLPHTWQRNTYQQWQGNTYFVDPGGSYFVRGTDGYWYPLQQR
ncbi:MAG: hypothetical protein ACHQJ7_01180 [Vicinamibacteria bacterium]